MLFYYKININVKLILQNYKLLLCKLKKIRFALMKKIVSAYFLLLLINGCSTDFDVIAPYKEVIVVDGLLNAIDSVQYVKISKAFLGEGNAYVMAKQSDSINFADVLDVKMERIINKQVLETFDLNRSELYDKDSGTFASPFHILYTTNHVILQDGSEYKLKVTNRQTGTTVTSQTKIIKDLRVTSPLQTNPPRDSIDLATAINSPSFINFEPGANSRIYDLIIRFHYREYNQLGDSSEHTINWNFADKNSSIPPNSISYKFYKYDLFSVIGSNIPDKPGYTRRIDSLSNGLRPYEFVLIQGTEDLQTYYQLQQPSTGIVQEPPTFTTVENGLGIFTSRNVHKLFYYPNSITEAAFDTSVSTRNKNFQFH